MPLPKMVTINEAAQLSKELEIGISKNYIRTLVKSGAIRYHLAGTKVLFCWDTLLEYLSNPPDQKNPIKQGIRPVNDRLVG